MVDANGTTRRVRWVENEEGVVSTYQHGKQGDASLNLLRPREHFVVGKDGIRHVERSRQVGWESV
eukprot:1194735-Prorocentrum_minimum.AAC.6